MLVYRHTTVMLKLQLTDLPSLHVCHQLSGTYGHSLYRQLPLTLMLRLPWSVSFTSRR